MDHGSIVWLEGRLRGMGHQAGCQVLARRVEVSGPDAVDRRFAYADASVIDAPADLPDGEYEVEFAGFSATARRRRGFWVNIGPASPAKEGVLSRL